MLPWAVRPGEGILCLDRARDRLFRDPWTAPLLSAYALHPNHDLVNEELIRDAHLRGLSVNTWTVNEPARMEELAQLRVNGLITDRPDLALEITRRLDPLQRGDSGMSSDG